MMPGHIARMIRAYRDEAERGGLLSKTQAVEIATRMLELVSSRSMGVQVEHRVHAMTRVVDGRIQSLDDGDELAFRFSTRYGSDLFVTIGGNQVTEAGVRRILNQIDAMSSSEIRRDGTLPDDPDDPIYYSYNPREYLPVSLWHEDTIVAIQSARSETIPAMIDQIRASGLVAAATVGVAARVSLTLYQPGLTSWSEETDCEVAVTARTPDGKASGWAGQANRCWSHIRPGDVVGKAVELANASRNMVGMEPGRYTTILGPAAVAQLLVLMPEMFDAYATDAFRSTPFTDRDIQKMNKIGDRMFDRRLRLVSDPQDPEGGYPPFFEVGSQKGIPGFPVGKQLLVDGGVLADLSYDLSYSLSMGKPPADNPFSMRLEAMPDVHTHSVDEMIAGCEHGIYVNRFSDVSLISLKTGMMTGVTRDGCFHIKNGRINKPIRNLRFTDSPIFAFNRILMIGASERVAFGYSPPTPSEGSRLTDWPAIGRATRWPRLPMIVPALMVQDFNFSGMAEAV